MAARSKSVREMSVWRLLEEAVGLLRRLPATAWLIYGTGAVPFIMGLLFFWGEMSQSALAEQHWLTASWGMALLFVWLKAWQSVFCEALLATHRDYPLEKWSWRRGLRMILLQTAVQPWALVAVPLALVFAIPFAWVWAFFQNYSWIGRGQDPSLRATVREAWRCACWAPRQNHYLLSLLSLTLLVVLMNWISAFAIIPYLLKSWLGVETWFTRTADAYWNLTFFAVVGALTWLTLDPLMKAVYTLRCFYAQARASGEDLKAELHRLQRAMVPALLLGLVFMPLAAPAAAATNPPSPAPPALPTQQLNQALDRTLQGREFLWRMPRQKLGENSPQLGFMEAFFKQMSDAISSWWEGVTLTLDKFGRWLDKLLGRRRLPSWTMDPDNTQTEWLSPLRFLLATLLAVMAFVWVRLGWRRRQRASAALAAAISNTAPAAQPDWQKDEVNPALLPEEEWLTLSRQMAGRGEWRLALRALYLAALAGLARREFLVLKHGKSNREYARELARRAHQHPDMVAPFEALMRDVERVWYGCHPADASLYQTCEQRLQLLQKA